MAPLKDFQDQFAELLQQQRQTKDQLLATREQTQSLQRKRAKLVADSEHAEQHLHEIAAIDSQLKALEGKAAQQANAARDAQAGAIGALSQFHANFTPQTLVGMMDDHIPVLLMPLRIETKFMSVQHRGGSSAHELWIRVYPDDVNIVSHEARLTDNEVTLAQNYWNSMYTAGGNIDAQKDAWTTLVKNVHAWQRAAWIVREYVPTNLQPSSTPKLQAPPQFPDYQSRAASWSKAPYAKALPDRFVFMAYDNAPDPHTVIGNVIPPDLVVGPDPTQMEDGAGMRRENDDLQVDASMKWMVDFDEAVAKGMGIRLPLTPKQATDGFQKIIVLGIRTQENPDQTSDTLAGLFEDHYYGTAGFSFVPNGTATNNVDDNTSGFDNLNPSAEESWNLVFGPEQYPLENDFKKMSDGRVFETLLDIHTPVLRRTFHAGGFDNRDHLAMNNALFPGTLGYFMEEMLHPSFKKDTIADVKTFFLNHVSARGYLPAFRVGSQPYSILPTSPFYQWQFTASEKGSNGTFWDGLYNTLKIIRSYWFKLSMQAVSAGEDGDKLQHLVDILGMHPGSVEFFQRFAMSPEQYDNLVKIFDDKTFQVHMGPTISYIIDKDAHTLLADIIINDRYSDLVFLEKLLNLDGPVVQDGKLSEKDALLAAAADGKNYIEWLSASPLDTIRKEIFGPNTKKPRALLYLFLRHAAMLNYYDASANVHISKKLLTEKPKEQTFHYIGANSGKSRWEMPYASGQTLTGNDNRTVADMLYNDRFARAMPEGQPLYAFQDALDLLKSRPTAKLERAFTDHIDLCTYRADAWMAGLLNKRLRMLREAPQRAGAFGGNVNVIGGVNVSMQRSGIVAGAFGYLEQVKPSNNVRKNVDLATVPSEFAKGATLQTDSGNAGYIAGPSLGHAVAGAVLRNGYITHADKDNPDRLKINLSSTRVRQALSLIEGIGNGQYIGALLGYQFERALHDAHNDENVEADQYIYAFRRKYPLVAGKLSPVDNSAPVEAQGARNVVDGILLIDGYREAIKKSQSAGDYITEVTGEASLTSTLIKVIVKAIDSITNAFDAVGDLAVSEGVYQVVQGNFERAGAMLKAVNEGKNIPQPEIIETPRTGYAVSQKVMLMLDAAATAASDATVRASFEPALNAWIGGMLPGMEHIRLLVSYTSGGVSTETEISMADLAIEPIDLLYMSGDKLQNGRSELDARIGWKIRRDAGLDDNAEVKLLYRERNSSWEADGHVALFDIMALLQHLRGMVQNSRTAGADDFVGSERQTRDELRAKNFDTAELSSRIQNLQSMAAPLQSLLANGAASLKTAPPPDDPAFDKTMDDTWFDNLRMVLYTTSYFVGAQAFPASNANLPDYTGTEEEIAAKKKIRADRADALIGQAEGLAQFFKGWNENYDKVLLDWPSQTEQQQVEAAESLVQALLGKGFRVLPRFTWHNPKELGQCHDDSENGTIFTHLNSPSPTDEWLFSLARVRPALHRLESAMLLNDGLQAAPFALKPLQTPYRKNDAWLGLQIPDDYKREGERHIVSCCFAGGHDANPQNFDTGTPQCGLMIDEWIEKIPDPKVTAGVAVHFDRPNAEPPQTLLLAVSPVLTGSWNWSKLVACVEDAFLAARIRAVEPKQIDKSPFGSVLPAIMLSVTTDMTTIGTNLGENNFAAILYMQELINGYNKSV